MTDINYFWTAHYENGFQLKGVGAISQIPKLEDVKVLEAYIFDEKKEIKYHLGVGLDRGMFYVNNEQINPHPMVLDLKPKLRPIFFLIRQRKFTLFPDGHKEPIDNQFFTAGLRIGWQTTVDGKNYQRMMVWIRPWNHIAIMSKR